MLEVICVSVVLFIFLVSGFKGRNHELGEFFLGQLAGVSILVNATETDHVIHCLHMCQERLDFTRLDDMETATVRAP